jgi:excisionase family DNA binding protein
MKKIRTLNEVLTAGSLLTVPEVAQALAVSIPMIYAMAKDGRLPCIKLGPTGVRFDPTQILDFIDERRVG